jgi:hypothetical protein
MVLGGYSQAESLGLGTKLGERPVRGDQIIQPLPWRRSIQTSPPGPETPPGPFFRPASLASFTRPSSRLAGAASQRRRKAAFAIPWLSP